MKPFVRLFRPEAGRHIHLGRRHIAPQRLAGAFQRLVAEFEREVGHGAGHVHATHGVPHHPLLLAHRDMGLIVLVGASPEVLRVLAARQRLLGEVMRLAAALIDEIGGEVEPAPIAGQAVEFDQRQLDLLMPAIAALLPCPAAEDRGDVIDVALHDIEQLAPSRGPKVSDRPLEQVPGVVKLVVVAQVGPALLGLAPVVPAVEIAVGRLRAREVVYDGVDFRFDVGIAPMGEGVACRLDPLADVRVPEDLRAEAVAVAWDFRAGAAAVAASAI